VNYQLKTEIMVLKWREEHTPLFLDLLTNRECLWNTKNEKYESKAARDIALQDILNELNLPRLAECDIRAKIKTVQTRFASELTKIKKSEISGAGRDYIWKSISYSH
jgi:hypothetical protein